MAKQKSQNLFASFSSLRGKLPLNIQNLLQKKGWTWPPDEKLKVEIHEAWERFCGSTITSPNILKEIHKYFPGRFPDSDEE